MLKLFVAFTLITLAAVASDAQQLKPLSYGVNDTENRPKVVIGDFAYFNTNDGGRYDIYRYGSGMGMTELGSDNVALSGKARNGLTVYGLKGQSGAAFHLGAGVMNLEGRLNSNSFYNTYYLWQPTLDVGVQAGVSKYIVLTVDARGGASIGNYYGEKNGLHPVDFDGAHGARAMLNVFDLHAAYEVIKFNRIDREIISIGVGRYIQVYQEKDDLNITRSLMVTSKW